MDPIRSSLDDLPVEVVSPNYSRRTVIGEHLHILWAGLKAGAQADVHHHPSEQFIWVLSGMLRTRVGELETVCMAGDIVLVPANVPHGATCLEDCEFFTVQTPVRPDLLPGTGVPDHMSWRDDIE